MAGSPVKDSTPSNKRQRAPTKNSAKSDKKKQLTTTSIASITAVNLDSSSDSEQEALNMASRNQDETQETVQFPVKKPNMIAVNDLEKLLDKRFPVLATAEQINKMSERIGRNESEISDIKGELRQINRKITERNNGQASTINNAKARALTIDVNADELSRLQNQLRSRRDEDHEESWGDSVNNLPLGQRSAGEQCSWQPPKRDEYSRMEFGGSR